MQNWEHLHSDKRKRVDLWIRLQDEEQFAGLVHGQEPGGLGGGGG